jgi:hypothetical protein
MTAVILQKRSQKYLRNGLTTYTDVFGYVGVI